MIIVLLLSDLYFIKNIVIKNDLLILEQSSNLFTITRYSDSVTTVTNFPKIVCNAASLNQKLRLIF